MADADETKVPAVAAELAELRQDQLAKLTALITALAWVYHIFEAINPWPVRIDGLPLLAVVLLSAGGAYLLRRSHFQAASWLLLGGTTLALCLILWTHPDSAVMYFAVLAIPVASTLLGIRQALLASLLIWLCATLALWLGAGSAPLDLIQMGRTFLFFGLILLMTWLSHAPLQTAVQWSLSAWEDTHKALLGARQRRAEIYRVARALEEATFRIERMNNELIVARAAAEVAKANKARFAATVSHELRGPLNLILGFSRLMVLSPERYGLPLPSAYRADIDTIYTNGQHLASLVDDILDLSQTEVGKLPLVKDDMLLQDVVRESVETIRALVERKGLYLRTDLAEELPPIHADPVRLRQVLINLLINAVRFTDRGGITLRTLRAGDEVQVSVQDTGRGIAPEEMTRLFEEFYRLQTTETAEVKGTGLGLAISKYLVELHGGRIWANSTLGVGTTFAFTLPLSDSGAVVPSMVYTADRREPTPYQTCLIVHRDPVIVKLLARHLDGYRVVGSSDAHRAFALTQELHPKAVIATPDLYQALQTQFRSAPFDVPLISCPMPDAAQHTIDNSTVGYLIKPIAPDVLEATMGRFAAASGTTVLIVDDDPDAVRLVEIMLMALPRQYSILKAYDGLQALEIMQESVPDLVFMDLVMPEMDGEQTIARMRASERLRGVPVIIISARDPFDQTAALGMPITIWSKESLPIDAGVRCLKALLDALNPHYLPAPTSRESPAPSQPEQRAC